MAELYEFNGLFQPKWFTDHVLNEITVWSEYKENQADKLLKIQPNPDKLQTSLSDYSLRDSILECHNGKLLKISVCLLVYAKMLSQAQPAPWGQKMPGDRAGRGGSLCLSGARDSVMTFSSQGWCLWGSSCGAVTAAHPMDIYPCSNASERPMKSYDLGKVTWLKKSRECTRQMQFLHITENFSL